VQHPAGQSRRTQGAGFDHHPERKGRVERWRGSVGKPCVFPALSVAGARVSPQPSVSTSPSSNRACGFAAPGSPTGFATRATDAPDEAPFLGLASCFRNRPDRNGVTDLAVNPRPVGHFHRVPEVRPLPSPGITRLRRYYEPVRHPSAARPVPRGRPVEKPLPPTAGVSRVASVLPVQTCCRHYPGGIVAEIELLP
jgi:hypothetical protein